ncbi:MAG: helix-turn-helix domain-containing protein [Patescibacteria group bacterium]|jgi:sugar-specific transcriptional regulator TrmB
MDIKTAVEKLGLNPKQAMVYLAILQIGAGNIQEIAQKSAVKRTTTYSILDNLILRGLVTYRQKGAHREYFSENPRKIPSLIERQIHQMEDKQRSIEEIMPELASLYNLHSTKPKVRVYEGIEGIKQVFEETLSLKRGEETLAYASYQTIKGYLSDFIKDYIRRRASRGITQRCIAEDSEVAREELVKNDKRDLRVTRLINKEKFPFDVDQINIYGNKMFIASYKDLLAVVIESAAIANTQRSIFELAWLGAEKATPVVQRS